MLLFGLKSQLTIEVTIDLVADLGRFAAGCCPGKPFEQTITPTNKNGPPSPDGGLFDACDAEQEFRILYLP